MSLEPQERNESLNESQATRLRVTCQYIDKLLGDVEAVLNTDISHAAFPRYAGDVLPAQRRTIDDYIARVRAQLVRILDGQGIEREKPSIPASRAILVLLGAIDIAAEELRPKYMRGFGPLPESVATQLNGIATELSGLVERFGRYLSARVGEDLGARLARLDHTGNDFELLKKIELTVRTQGLVEFRPTIAAILDRAEDRSFEIAVFGRVSSGKSSLLNAILGNDVLPVGVTPITAVPTRVRYAQEPLLSVWFAEAPSKELEVSRLAEFASEEQNPGNAKHVTRLVVGLPATRLRDGIAFVDTPGLGSLATRGASETLAYLPTCDLGVVLVDAGSTLTHEDLQTILALKEAAVPINVLLSKADLLALKDRARLVDYVKGHIASQCHIELNVYPVSVIASETDMLEKWFATEIVPLYARSQELRAASTRRKIGALRDSVAAALESRLKRRGQSSPESADRVRAVEATLRKATGEIEETRSLCEKYSREALLGVPEAIETAAKRFLHASSTGSYGVVVPGQLVRDSITQSIQLQVRKLQGELAHLGGDLEQALRQSAAVLAIPDVPNEGEFESAIRGTPVFDASSFNIAVSFPRLTKLLGTRIAQLEVERQIRGHLRKPFYDALETYWQLTWAWADSVLRQLKQKFENYAESYRARAEQLVGGRDLAENEIQAAEEALARLSLSELQSDEAAIDVNQIFNAMPQKSE